MNDAAHTPEFEEPSGMEIVSRAGTGRRSVWFQARQVRLDRPVALKYLHPLLAENGDLLEMFLEAGRQAAAMIHPSALSIINVHPRQHCIVVQWCGEPSLRALERSLDPARAALAGETVMDCLSALHATGRCHGNISPGNIFLGEDGGVWLDDFFQPPRMRAGATRFNADGRFVAPEADVGAPADWRADVYGLGRVLEHAVRADHEDAGLRKLVRDMCSPDPAARGESPQAVLQALRDVRAALQERLGLAPGGLRRKRMYRRVPAEFDVSLRRRSVTPGETAAMLMKIRDIGESGVFVETNDESLGIGSILELDFTLKGLDGNIHAFGIVRWRSNPPLPKGVGVQFVEVDQAGLRNLRQFLDGK